MANKSNKDKLNEYQVSMSGEMIGNVYSSSIIEVFKHLAKLDIVDIDTCTIVRKNK